MIKKWVALLIISLLAGVTTIYADWVGVDTDGDGSPDIYVIADGTHTFDNITVEYDSSTGELKIINPTNNTINYEIKASLSDPTPLNNGSVSSQSYAKVKNDGGSWSLVGIFSLIATKAPIPPIAIALTLMTIPIIALRRYN